ncbi:MAG: glycosyltransferase family 2 protein [Bergeyella sp.]
MMISVIIPVCNAENTLAKTLDSVRNQTYPQENFEIIITNDGSADRSVEVIQQYQNEHPEMNITLLNQANKGVSAARNTGLKAAKGDFIALLDADDEWLPEKTERQISYFKNPDFEMDFLATTRNNSEILFPYKVKKNLAEITFRKLMLRNEAQPSTVIFRKKVLENTGFFDENQKYAEDVNYWLKISLNNKMYILNESLVIAGSGKRTFGVSGLSANLPEMQKGYQKTIKEMYQLKKITFPEYIFYRYFYKLKHLVLLLRTWYYNRKSKTD